MNDDLNRSVDPTLNNVKDVAADQNRDPITNAPDSHPGGTGIGSASGAVTGAALGAVGGPVGALIGGVAGAITGAAMGHKIGEASAEDDVQDGVAADGLPGDRLVDADPIDPVLDRDIQVPPTETTVRPTATTRTGGVGDVPATIDRV